MKGHKAYTEEGSNLSKDLIIDKCNSVEMKYELTIADMSNYSIYNSLTHGGNYVFSLLYSLGYKKCLKREASNYAVVSKVDNERDQYCIWINKI